MENREILFLLLIFSATFNIYSADQSEQARLKALSLEASSSTANAQEQGEDSSSIEASSSTTNAQEQDEDDSSSEASSSTTNAEEQDEDDSSNEASSSTTNAEEQNENDSSNEASSSTTNAEEQNENDSSRAGSDRNSDTQSKLHLLQRILEEKELSSNNMRTYCRLQQIILNLTPHEIMELIIKLDTICKIQNKNEFTFADVNNAQRFDFAEVANQNTSSSESKYSWFCKFTVASVFFGAISYKTTDYILDKLRK